MKIDFREDYIIPHPPLNLTTTPATPNILFAKWYTTAYHHHRQTANVMALSTLHAQKYPQTRMVLLREYHENTYVFYTNYSSAKGKAISAHPYVALTFIGMPTSNKIRIEGVAEPLDKQASTTYFKARPFGSQVAAVASAQSAPLAARATLEAKITSLTSQYQDKPTQLKRPSNWGGYRIYAYYYEFWQGRPSRLHERLVYKLTPPPQPTNMQRNSCRPPPSLA